MAACQKQMDGAIWVVHAALILTQLSSAGFNVLTKAALSNGVNQVVFAVYRSSIGVVLVAAFGYFLEKEKRTRFTGSLFLLLCFAGFTGVYANQVLFMTGLALTSSGYAASLQIAIPIFTFLIAIVFRTEEVNIRRKDGQAKILGVIFSLGGAVLMTVYKGPIVLGYESPAMLNASADKLRLYTPGFLASTLTKYGITAWQFGSASLVLYALFMGIFVNLQAPILARYPAPLSATAISMLFGTALLGANGAVTVQDSSAWVLTCPFDIFSVAYAGSMASAFNFAINTWCVQRCGPFLVGAYIPLQPVVSAIVALLFLGDVIYLGSVLGATLVLLGLYVVTWGKAQSLTRKKQDLSCVVPPLEEPCYVDCDLKQPLLPSPIDKCSF